MISSTEGRVRCDSGESKGKVTGPGDSKVARGDGEFPASRSICTGQRGTGRRFILGPRGRIGLFGKCESGCVT